MSKLYKRAWQWQETNQTRKNDKHGRPANPPARFAFLLKRENSKTTADRGQSPNKKKHSATKAEREKPPLNILVSPPSLTPGPLPKLPSTWRVPYLLSNPLHVYLPCANASLRKLQLRSDKSIDIKRIWQKLRKRLNKRVRIRTCCQVKVKIR